MKNLLAILLLIIAISSCDTVDQEECAFQPDVSGVNIKVNIEQLQDSFASISSKQEMIALLTRQPAIRDQIFRRAEYPNDSAFVNALYQKFSNPHFDTLMMETKRVFGDLSVLQSQFEEAFKNIQYYYPQFNVPRIQTVVSGLDTDLVVSDSLIIVGLDFYLGKDAKYRPKMYEYLLRRYEPEDIVPSILLVYGIDDRINKTNLSDKSVLADMIAYGKSFYFAKHMLPCTPDSTLMWYTAEEMDGSRKNEDLIWARFVQDKIVFSTSMIEKRNYLGERPITTQVGEKCPGRIGQWIGWRIVQAYMNQHPETTLPQLMAMNDAQKLFKASKYKPRKR